MLHEKLTRFMARALSRIQNIDYQLWSSEGGEEIECLVNELQLTHHLQQGEGLGERLQHCVKISADRFSKILIVGSDCPFLNEDVIQVALHALDKNAVVFVPANDGGYVLVGVAIESDNKLEKLLETLFNDIPWGTNKVLEISLQKLDAVDLNYALLKPLSDIDRPEDLSLLNTINGFD